MSFNPQDLISRSDAVANIAERIRKQDETELDAHNRVSHRLSYAIKVMKLPKPMQGKFCFNDIALWAQGKWPGKFDDWPSVNTANIKLELPKFEVSASLFCLPKTIGECHSEITRLHSREVELIALLQTANDEIERLRPDAESWKNKVIEKNRQSGKVPRHRY